MHSSARQIIIPAILISFSLISLITLKSITPELSSVQLLFWIIGFSVFMLISKIKISILKKNHWLGYAGLNGLLLLTLLMSNNTRGTARWLKVGELFSIQPSQLAVPILAFSLALFASKHKLNSLQNLGKFLTILVIPSFLIVIEPDLGTTIHLIISMGVIILLSEIKNKYIFSMIGLGIVGIVLAWSFFLKPYQQARITSFISSQSNQNSVDNYNSFQSQIAVGSGQLYGKGIGQGSQSHLRFLPERQTDFIFASFAEEWGFIGSSILLALYALLTLFLLYFAINSQNLFDFYFLFVTNMAIAFQLFVNVGMNIGLLPITGVTLPFVSYGGSSLISLCLLLGVAQNIILNQKKKLILDIK